MEDPSQLVSIQNLTDLVTELPVADAEIVREIVNEMLYVKDCADKFTGHTIETNPAIISFMQVYFDEQESRAAALYASTSVYKILELKGPLPSITLSTAKNVMQEGIESKRDDYVFGHLLHIKRKDPSLAGFISDFSEVFDNPMPALQGAVFSYRLLEKQAEQNKIKIN